MEGFKKQKYIHTIKKRFDPFALFGGLALLIYLISVLSGESDWKQFMDLRSLFIVCGGTLASLLIQFDFSSVLACLIEIFNSFRRQPEKIMLQTLAELDNAILNDVPLPELREGLKIDGDILNDIIFMLHQYLSFEEIDEFVRAKVEDLYFKKRTSIVILERAGVLAPSLGLFGTVVGLVTLLKSLSDPALIGPSMALALLTTAYGAGISSLIVNPLAGRLEQNSLYFIESNRQLLSKVAILFKRYEKAMAPGHVGRVG